jgi:hypothetical protein
LNERSARREFVDENRVAGVDQVASAGANAVEYYVSFRETGEDFSSLQALDDELAQTFADRSISSYAGRTSKHSQQTGCQSHGCTLLDRLDQQPLIMEAADGAGFRIFFGHALPNDSIDYRDSPTFQDVGALMLGEENRIARRGVRGTTLRVVGILLAEMREHPGGSAYDMAMSATVPPRVLAHFG